MLFFYALLFFLLPTFVVAAPGRSATANGNPVEKKGESLGKGEPLSDQVAYLVDGTWIRDGDYIVSSFFLNKTYDLTTYLAGNPGGYSRF
jgi:hypothetical protein